MVMVRLGASLINVKGRIAGNYFQKSNHGIHMKAFPRRVKSQNIARQTTIKIFSPVQNAWRDKVWTIAEIENWNAFLQRHPAVNALGDQIIITHQLGFFKFNLIRVHNGLPVNFNPPREILL